MTDYTDDLKSTDMVKVKTAELMKAVHESKEYTTYMELLDKIKKKPELYARVCEYRRHNFQLQNTEVDENLYDIMMKFRLDNAKVRQEPLINDFLRAELGLCRLVQSITCEIMDGIHFDIDFIS